MFSYEKIKRYLKDLLSDKERYIIEREIEKNPFEKEAMEGFDQISPEEFVRDVKELQYRISKHKDSKKSVLFSPKYQVAASLLLLLGIGFFLLSKFNESKNTSNPIVNIEKGLKKDTTNTEVVATEKPKVPSDVKPSEELFDRKIVNGTLDEIREYKKDPIAFEAIEDENSVLLNKNSNDLKNKDSEETVIDEVTSAEEGKATENGVESTVVRNESLTDSSIVFNKGKETLSKNYTGIVNSQIDGLPVPGVTVKIRNSKNGTVTDFDGQYTIAAAIGDTIEFKAIGFESHTIIAAKTEKLAHILLQEKVETLGETVVIGYGTVEKKEITGAVTKTKVATLKKTRSATFEAALEGSDQGGESIKTKEKLVQENNTFTNKENFKKWVYTHLNSEVFEKGTPYEASVSFTIAKTGRLKNIEVKTDLPLPVKKEIERTLLASPKWNSALKKGKKVTQQIDLKLEINF